MIFLTLVFALMSSTLNWQYWKCLYLDSTIHTALKWSCQYVPNSLETSSSKRHWKYVCVLVGQWGEAGVLGSVLGNRWLSERCFALIGEKIAEWKSSLFPGRCYFRRTAGLRWGTGDGFRGSCPHSTLLLRTWLARISNEADLLSAHLAPSGVRIFCFWENRISWQGTGREARPVCVLNALHSSDKINPP